MTHTFIVSVNLLCFRVSHSCNQGISQAALHLKAQLRLEDWLPVAPSFLAGSLSSPARGVNLGASELCDLGQNHLTSQSHSFLNHKAKILTVGASGWRPDGSTVAVYLKKSSFSF